MDSELLAIVNRRLNSDTSVDDAIGLLVLAACDGRDAVLETLGKSLTPERLPASDAAPPPPEPKGAYLRALTVEGFRGIGKEARLELPPGPGLTLVVGRNGSGKSSLAEGLEVLLTGDTLRWHERTQEWRAGFQNLHHPGPAKLTAEVFVDGQDGPTTIVREVATAGDAGQLTVQPKGKPRGGMELLGWGDAVISFRPFLSYNELGAILEEGPSHLYDALSSILGLGELTEARESLRGIRLEREKARKDAAAKLDPLLRRLGASADERARKAVDALNRKVWDLDTAELILLGASASEGTTTSLANLRELASLRTPDRDAIDAAASGLSEALGDFSALKGTDAARANALATILDQALAFHREHDVSRCPVCGATSLTEQWRNTAEGELEQLRDTGSRYDAVRNAIARAVNESHGLIAAPPPSLASAADLDVDVSQLAEAWNAWTQLRSEVDPAALAAALIPVWTELSAAMIPVSESARTLLDQREDEWRPLARDLGAWLGPAREAVKGEADVPVLRSAERWIEAADAAVRDERFEPIAAKVTSIWERFRQNSNVALEPPNLGGTGNRRRVELRVNVDGAEGVALGVMSQGELHALALSLFLPRATMPQSPFRFLIIDDPVQAMDPVRVDGLARVLEDTSRDHQVIVFTHDDRLPESIRRLGISATVIEVTRREGSVVELRQALDPIQRYIEDARALSRTDDLPPGVAERVIPTFCRLAIDAACVEAIRRRRLARGDPHREVEGLLEAHQTLNSRAALAFFDDPERAGDVLARINRDRELGRSAGDAFQRSKQEAHQPGAGGDLREFVEQASRLARGIEKLR